MRVERKKNEAIISYSEIKADGLRESGHHPNLDNIAQGELIATAGKRLACLSLDATICTSSSIRGRGVRGVEYDEKLRGKNAMPPVVLVQVLRV